MNKNRNPILPPGLWWAGVLYWRRQWQPTPVLLPGKSHGRRNLVGCSPWGHQESDTTQRLHFHFSLSCIGEGNGNPLQWSCLENPRDRGAWWAAIYGVAQSRTWPKQLGSSSSRGHYNFMTSFNEIQDCITCVAKGFEASMQFLRELCHFDLPSPMRVWPSGASEVILGRQKRKLVAESPMAWPVLCRPPGISFPSLPI